MSYTEYSSSFTRKRAWSSAAESCGLLELDIVEAYVCFPTAKRIPNFRHLNAVLQELLLLSARKSTQGRWLALKRISASVHEGCKGEPAT